MDLHLKKIPSLRIKNAQGWIYMTPRCQTVVYKKLKKTSDFLADKTLYSKSEQFLRIISTPNKMKTYF